MTITTPNTTAHGELVATPYASPLGVLTIVTSPRGLRAVLWADEQRRFAWLDDTKPQPARAPDATTARAIQQLDEYFAGERTQFDLPLDLVGTEFQIAAWRSLATIPYGETRTYAEQAALLGRPSAVRAVGAANGRNAVSIVLPCHRVVGRNGALTGFAGGLDAKRYLLDHERRR